ncbi:hypothetical protein Q7C36_011529 [Tachysurus vachellii]|uniref:Uncharacterized protein n=1 Tax=Tachysurus vachellii TaxID=175792 RepID=A0AA88MRU5_TACVA|nr:hypothetical protein Q7C36_011529 [Tachysurus vachellii]
MKFHKRRTLVFDLHDHASRLKQVGPLQCARGRGEVLAGRGGGGRGEEREEDLGVRGNKTEKGLRPGIWQKRETNQGRITEA